MPPLCENPDRYAYHSDGVETNRLAKGRRRGMAGGGETTIARAAAVHNQRLEATGLDQACRAQLMASERAAGCGGQCERWGQRLGPAGFWVPFLRHIAPQEAALGLWGEDAMPAVVGAERRMSPTHARSNVAGRFASMSDNLVLLYRTRWQRHSARVAERMVAETPLACGVVDHRVSKLLCNSMAAAVTLWRCHAILPARAN